MLRPRPYINLSRCTYGGGIADGRVVTGTEGGGFEACRKIQIRERTITKKVHTHVRQKTLLHRVLHRVRVIAYIRESTTQLHMCLSLFSLTF